MNKMSLTLPTVQCSLSISLPAGPTAAAEARGQVREAIAAWGMSVDPYAAALLTSELVTNAIRHAAGPIRLFVTSSCGHLRVYVHDASSSWATPSDTSLESEGGRGLLLVAKLSTTWGCYRTASGKAVYFTLAPEPDQDFAGSPGA